jgi:hypothetical protein
MSAEAVLVPASGPQKVEKKPVKFSNLLLGAGLNMFEVTTLGQPLEVTKTTMAAHRTDTFAGAMTRIWGRGGIFGCKSSDSHQLADEKMKAPRLTETLYSLPRSHSVGLDRSLYQGRCPPIRRLRGRVLCEDLRRWQFRRRYHWWYGGRFGSSLRDHGFLHMHENRGDHAA